MTDLRIARPLAALALGGLAASPGLAQQAGRNCAPHAMVVERLAAGYGESRQSIALGANNAVVEVFASLETGTWTITVTVPGGPTCLVASGLAYESVTEALPNTDQGA